MTKEPLKGSPDAAEAVLTTGQVAKYCHVDIRTANRWIDKGLLRAHELPITGFRRIRLPDFLDFLHTQKIPVPLELGTLGKKRLLIVDDDLNMAAAMRRALNDEPFDDCVVEVAYDGFEAGRLLERITPCVIILDLKMPGMSGFEVCRRLKAQERTRAIKILAVSGTHREADWQEIAAAGADAFLEKPFDDSMFKAKVLELLQPKGEPYGTAAGT